jgi:hypothetical protein
VGLLPLSVLSDRADADTEGRPRRIHPVYHLHQPALARR